MNGSETVDLSSFVIQPYRRKFLRDYCRQMSQDNLGQLWDDNVASVLQEQGFSIMDNPRSVYKVEKLYQALARYQPRNCPEVCFDTAVKAGIDLAYTCFAKPQDVEFLELDAFTPKFVLSVTSNHQGSAGLTAWGKTKAESYVMAFDRAVEQIKGKKRPEPCIAFKRTQINDKTRLIWGYPYAMTAIEGIFARPLIDRFKLGSTPMAFGMPTGMLGSKLRVSSRHKEWAYSTDVSSFDSSISSKLISVAFNILKTWFDFSMIEPTTSVPYEVIWDQIVQYFIYTPIVMPDGNVYKGKKHGVPSGSYFTQMIDSIVNVIIVGAISHHFSLHVDKDDIFVLGDDVLFWSNRHVELKDIAGYASKTFGMKFNVEKSAQYNWRDPIHYLGRDWIDGMPELSEDRILEHMTQPERYRKYPKDKELIKRQVRLLLLSYAAVYRNAYKIYIRCIDISVRYNQTNMSIENWVYNAGAKQGTYGFEGQEDNLSGLQRYLLKYVFPPGECAAGNTPLALQFWK